MPKRFKKIYIEITNICNLDCSFCPKTTRNAKSMDVDEFKLIIEKIKDYTDHVYFHLMGEPLLNANLAEFLDICENNGLNVNLTTNGFLIEQNSNMLKNKRFRKITFSLHSYESNQPKLSLIKYVEDILNFCDTVSDKIVELRLWNENGKDSLNEEILKILEKHYEQSINIEKNSKIKDNVYIGRNQKFDWPDIKNSENCETVFCYGLKDQIGILSSGDVVPCCLDNNGSINLGNIFDNSMHEILSFDRTKNIIDGFKQRIAVEKLCQKCTFSQRF